jgi:hypothetical protein
VVERRAKEGIAICTERPMPGDADTPGGSTDRVLIRLEDSDVPFSYGRDLVCHEFVHAVTGQPDGPYDQDSCMRGPLSDFGSFDIAVMWEEYDALPVRVSLTAMATAGSMARRSPMAPIPSMPVFSRSVSSCLNASLGGKCA